MVKIPRPVRQLNQSIAHSKELLTRLSKGQEYIEQAYKDKSVARVFEAAILFNKLAKELNDELERALFMHECASTGRTVLLNRKGKSINVEHYIEGEAEPVDLWTLDSIQKLRETFGEEAIVEVEFE